MRRVALGAVLLTATLAMVASGCGGTKPYSQNQVKSAFKSQGIRLTVATYTDDRGRSHVAPGHPLVPAPNSGVPMFGVDVRKSEKGLEKYLRPARGGGRYRMTVPGLPSKYALQNRNVVVMSRSGLDPEQKRITLAVESLH